MEQGHHVIGVDDLSYGSMINLDNAISNNNFDFIEFDVKKINKDFTPINIDIIYHLASYKKPINEKLNLQKSLRKTLL